MRTQQQNPMWREFKHLLDPTNGRYPAQWVDIFSNTDKHLRYRDVEVVFVPRGKDAPKIDRALWDEFAAYNRKWMADLGNSVAGWMEPDGWTPEHVFGFMLDRGFVDQGELSNALTEFANIEGCEWASSMRDGRLMKNVLIKGARDRNAVVEALRDFAHRPDQKWAAVMLSAIVEDDEEKRS